MITMQLLTQVVFQHMITKIFGKPGRAILTTFKNSEVEVMSQWSGKNLKITIKNVKDKVSMDKTPVKNKLWTPGSGNAGIVKPKIISAGTT